MLANIKLRLQDMDTLRQLLLTAEACARTEGVPEPGAEHLVQAALKLPDGTALRAFRRVDAGPEDFAAAVTQQYAEALARIGMQVGAHLVASHELPPRGERADIFKSQPSAQSLIQRLAKTRRTGPRRPLVGADILLAALSSDLGAVARALKVMGIEAGALADACRAEIEASGSKK